MNILITGANRGLGFKLVSESLARGHHVWAGVRDVNTKVHQLTELQRVHPGRVSIIYLNVSDEANIEQVATELSESVGHFDAIINNAAILVARGMNVEDIKLEDLNDSFHINLFGPFLIIKYFLQMLYKGSNQSIINISSESGSFAKANDHDYPYALSKSGLNMFTAQLYKELTPKGFQVLAVHPGWIKTDMGGAEAPGDPAISAHGILDLVERKIEISEGTVFVDHRGHKQPL